MKRINFIKIFPLFLTGLFSFSSASDTVKAELLKANDNGSQTLRILNMEDYIYITDELNGYTAPDLVKQFETYIKANYPEYQNVKVIYDTTDTNETLFNELQTGKSLYDLVCPSDYMIQKLITQDMLTKLDRSKIPNYVTYCSKKIGKYLDDISAINSITNEECYLKDYSVGYMWGTLGILFNPTYSKIKVDIEEMVQDLKSWDVFWNKKYKKTISIKDSMRDTYAAALMYTFDDELSELRSQYVSSSISLDEYKSKITEIFNRSDKDSIKKVSSSLAKLKKNIFGLEVDSGKEDIVTGKIGMNLAWSGDAVYSMDQADNAELVSEPFELYYSIPDNGGNVWFDGWVMPKLDNNKRSDAQYDLAHLFLNFISDPINAKQNIDFTGYTSFIAGDNVLELIRDWYDVRTDIIYLKDEESEEYYDDVIYFDPITNEETSVDFNDVHFSKDADSEFDNVKLYGVIEGEDNVLLEQTFNERLVLPDEVEIVDLTYFFEGTLNEYENGIDDIFYSTCYHPFLNEDGTRNISVGRQFFTQYPDEECINRCAVMKDYGKDNDAILKMWENFKSDPLPAWAITLFICEIVLIAGGIIFYFSQKRIRVYLRKNR